MEYPNEYNEAVASKLRELATIIENQEIKSLREEITSLKSRLTEKDKLIEKRDLKIKQLNARSMKLQEHFFIDIAAKKKQLGRLRVSEQNSEDNYDKIKMHFRNAYKSWTVKEEKYNNDIEKMTDYINCLHLTLKQNGIRNEFYSSDCTDDSDEYETDESEEADDHPVQAHFDLNPNAECFIFEPSKQTERKNTQLFELTECRDREKVQTCNVEDNDKQAQKESTSVAVNSSEKQNESANAQFVQLTQIDDRNNEYNVMSIQQNDFEANPHIVDSASSLGKQNELEPAKTIEPIKTNHCNGKNRKSKKPKQSTRKSKTKFTTLTFFAYF